MRHLTWIPAFALLSVTSPAMQAACCYFSPRNTEILQPAQKVFITWAPAEKIESFTLQPAFEGNALDFSMVIPTPTRPKLEEMPRDFFKHLAIYTAMKRRQHPGSKLLPLFEPIEIFPGNVERLSREPNTAIKILETGVVGSLDYKIVEAGRADELFQWLKDNHYRYFRDETTLNYYVQKKWVFTVAKINAMQMKRKKDGTYAGEATPTRFRFSSEQLVYPLRITQISVREKMEVLFYVQAPYKVDLPEDMTHQYLWVGMLDAARACTPGGLPGGGDRWLEMLTPQLRPLQARADRLNFRFADGQRLRPNEWGYTPTTLEWARKLSKEDIGILTGKSPYCEKVPEVDDGFTAADGKDKRRGLAIAKVIRARLARSQKARPLGYLVREAPEDDITKLQELAGHLEENRFITKFRKSFARDELNRDLLIVPARYGAAEDHSEYEEMLPTSR